MNPENFGKNLKIVINFLGITQIELSKKSGLTPAAISQIVNGERNVTLESLCKILSVIPVSFERLIK